METLPQRPVRDIIGLLYIVGHQNLFDVEIGTIIESCEYILQYLCSD